MVISLQIRHRFLAAKTTLLSPSFTVVVVVVYVSEKEPTFSPVFVQKFLTLKKEPLAIFETQMESNFRVSAILLLGSLFLSCLSGLVLSAIVTLDSIEIYKTHEFLKKPEVYFQCKGENKTDLPDVKKANEFCKFKGEESWQPLTDLPDKKCKRCGFYEKDWIKSDDVFDEWEFCPSDFTSDGKYIRFKEKEVNATFSCPKCLPTPTASNSASDSSHIGRKGTHVALIMLISALVSTVLILGLISAYKYWQKKKREQDQARFLKLFEEGDDIEDELGLGTVI